ncbi:hypothetical protein MRX96_001083 [Rhipicephalus microplus]
MNSLKLYSELFRKVFESDLEDHGAWADIYRLLSLLMQALTCSVCGNVLVVPMTSSTSKCRHAVCKGCMGQTMRLSAPCADCNSSTSGFTENKQLRIVLQCYKNICLYLSASTTVPAQAPRVFNRTSAVAAATVTKSVSGDRARHAVLLNGDAMTLANDHATSAPYELIKVPAAFGMHKSTHNNVTAFAATPESRFPLCKEIMIIADQATNIFSNKKATIVVRACAQAIWR